MPDRRRGAVLIILFATGWAANHFAALLPVLARTEGFSAAVLDGAFGIYAVGLLPGLLGGGGLSDRWGRRPVALTGAAAAGAGNLCMLLWHDEPGVYLGRLVVGVGAGLTISAGTAWAADLGGRRGATQAGVVLTSGFAMGPFASGLVAQFAPGPVAVPLPFAVTALLSAVTVSAALRVPTGPAAPDGTAPDGATPDAVASDGRGVDEPAGRRSVAAALATSVPMALWVFSTVTVAIVVLVHRMAGRWSGPWLPGTAAVVSLGAGVLVQLVARRAGWGPASGVAGAVLAAGGFGLTALAGAAPGPAMFLLCVVVLGGAYGLCLRQGLLDVETFAPARTRGTVIGVFYVCTYLGFGLPLLLEAIRPAAGIVTPMIVLAGLALLAAAARGLQARV